MNQKTLECVEYLAQRLNITEQRAYQVVREGLLPQGVVVRLGRQIRIDPERLENFIRDGGKSLPGGWKKGPE
jgi:hypothetical protein